MSHYCLILYSRKGCCLCEGLEQRLKKITLLDFTPPINSKIIDIDHCDSSSGIKNKYDLKVPVLAIKIENKNKIIELPRVSPRLSEKDLCKWIQQRLSDVVFEYPVQ